MSPISAFLPRPLPLLPCLLSSLLVACSGDTGASAASPRDEPIASEGPEQSAERVLGEAAKAPVSDEAKARIAEMMEQLVPLDPTLTSDHHDRHFIANRKMMAELREAPQELGLAAMLAYADYNAAGGDNLGVRRGLLDIAAHCAPEDAEPLLVHLMLEYGYEFSDRTEAALLLAETSPEVYLEVAREHVVRKHRPKKTMPNDEFLVRGWVTACELTGRSPVPELAEVVMNLMMEDAARHFAAEALGNYEDILARRALETAMIESSGNSYLRRKAAQSLVRVMPRETACELFQLTLEREADLNFSAFLLSMLQHYCSGSK